MQRLTLVFTLALIILLVVACNSATPAPTSPPPPGQGNQPPKVKPTVVEPTNLPQAKPTAAKPTIVEPTVPPKATTFTVGSIPTPGPTTAVSFLKECVMAKSVNATTFAPIDVTTKYDLAQKTYYAVCRVEQMPTGTAFKAVWSAWPAKLGLKLKLAETTLDLRSQSGSGYFDFHTDAYGNDYTEGWYRVEVYVNDKLARTIDFSVAK